MLPHILGYFAKPREPLHQFRHDPVARITFWHTEKLAAPTDFLVKRIIIYMRLCDGAGIGRKGAPGSKDPKGLPKVGEPKLKYHIHFTPFPTRGA